MKILLFILKLFAIQKVLNFRRFLHLYQTIFAKLILLKVGAIVYELQLIIMLSRLQQMGREMP